MNYSSQHWVISGTESLLLGGACATVAFTIGYYVDDVVSESTAGNLNEEF